MSDIHRSGYTRRESIAQTLLFVSLGIAASVLTDSWWSLVVALIILGIIALAIGSINWSAGYRIGQKESRRDARTD